MQIRKSLVAAAVVASVMFVPAVVSAATWNYSDGSITDGTWTFSASLDGTELTIGAVQTSPDSISALDFSGTYMNGETALTLIALNPAFGPNSNPTTHAAKVGVLTMPGSGLVSIGDYAFCGCVNATGTMNFPATLTTVGSHAFEFDSQLTFNAEPFPSEVKVINNRVFAECHFPDSVSFPYVTELGVGAFRDSYIRRISFGSALAKIGGSDRQGAFNECTNLVSVTFDANSQIDVDADYLFYGCKNLVSLDLSAVTNIVSDSSVGPFCGCTSLRHLRFGTLPSLPDNIFWGASSSVDGIPFVTDLHFTGAAPTLSGDWRLPDPPTSWDRIQIYKSRMTTFVHLDSTASTYEADLASWKALTADGNLATGGTTWNSARAGSADNAAKRPLLLWKSPTISIDTANSVDADEGAEGYGYFLLTRGDDDPLETTIPVNFTIGGTATAGRTYCSIYPDIDIKAGEKTVKVKVRPLNDPVTTSDTTVTLTLDTDPVGYYSVGATASATLAVKNAAKYGGHLYADAGKWNLLAHMGNTGLDNITANTVAAAKCCVDHGYAFEVDVQWDEATDVLYLGHSTRDDITADWTNTFQNVLAMLPTGAVFKIDAKCSSQDGAVRAIVAAIKADKTDERASLSINYDPGITWELMHKECPNVDCWSYSGPGTTSDPAANAASIAEGDLNSWNYGHSYAWNEEEMTDEFFAEFNKRGITIDVWTIEDTRTIKELINRGARYITTNNPFPVTDALPWAAEPVPVEEEVVEPAACQWTMELWNTNSWTRPAAALAGGVAANDQDGDISTCSDVYTSTDFSWTFSQPMDLTSLTLYTMPGCGRETLAFTNGVLVKYQGSSEFVKLANSERRCYAKLWDPQAIVFAGTNGTAFATNVVAIKLTPTQTPNGFTQMAETVLLGTASSGGGDDPGEDDPEFQPGWNVRNFDADDYERPATALTGTRIDNMSVNHCDGDITTSSGLSTWYTYGLEFSTPKDITEVRIYPVGDDETKYSIPNISELQVKYQGDDSYTELSGTGYVFDSTKSWTNCIQMVLRPLSGQYIAKRIIGIKVCFSGVTGGTSSNVAEFEFLGADAFIPSLTAAYEPGDNVLTATLTAVAKYPTQVWFCSGNTDAGTASTNAWDRVIPAFTATSGDSVIDPRSVNFKYCRYCFEDADDGFIWSDGFIWTDEPAGTAEIGKCGSTLFKFNVSASWCGGTNSSVSVYTAAVAKGGEMPQPQLAASGIVRNGSVEVTIDGLTPETEYDWLVRLQNADGTSYDIIGTATTVTAGAIWFQDPYDYANWSVPSNWLPGFTDSTGSLCDGEVLRDTSSEAQRADINNKTNTWTFSSPKDIETLEILMNSCTLEVLGVEVMYYGSSVWTALPNATLSYSDAAPGGTLRRGVFKIADGGYFAENVSAIRVATGTCNPGHVGCCEMLVTGRDHAQVCHWEVGRYTAADYTASSDALSAMSVKSNSGCSSDAYKTLFTNADITDSSLSVYEYYNGGDIYWEFDEPMNIRQLRIVGSTNGTYPNFGCDGVWVKYDGDDDYTLLEGSAFAAFNWSSSGSASYLKLTGETAKWFARGVTAVKARIVVYNWRVDISEVELAGEAGVAETFAADYTVTGRNLAASATPGAAEYPVKAYFCSGMTDGGTDGTNDWTSVTEVATLTGSSDVAEWSGAIAFNYCRFCFWSKKYEEWVWSDLGDVRQNPAGTVALGTVTHESAGLTATLADAGAPATTADVYVAYDKAENPSEYALEKSGMTAGDYNFTIDGLTENTTYYYSVMFTNASDMAVCVNGSFTTPWSPAELERPIGVVGIEDVRSAQATAKITLTTPGNGADAADIWFASVVHDGEMPALTRIATGVAAAEVETKTLSDLEGSTTYDYRVVLSNALSRTREYTGSFTTLQGVIDDPDTPVVRDVPYRALPSGYQQVAYLKSTGGVGINTGIKSSAAVSLVMDFAPNDYGNYIGQFDGDDNNDWRFEMVGYIEHMDIGATRANTYVIPPLNTRYQVSVGPGASYAMSSNGVAVASDSVSGSPTCASRDIGVFGLVTGDNGQFTTTASMTLWSLVMTNDSTLVRDFVPAVRQSDSAAGLYDLVSGEFFGNCVTGSSAAFETGAVVSGMDVSATVNYSFTTREWTMAFDVVSGTGALYAVVQDASGNRKVALVKENATAGDHLVYTLEIPVGDEYQIGYKTIVGDFKDYTFLKTAHQKPVGEITYGTITKRSAEVVLTLTTSGELEPTSDFYFAYAKKGETMPALVKVASGLATGAVVTNLLEGLEYSTEYDCVLVCSKSVYGASVESSFMTDANWKWTTAEFDPTTFMPDPHWIGDGNGTITTYYASWYAGYDYSWTFSRAQNLHSMAFYSTDGGRNDVALSGVEVQYSGSSDWVTLPASELAYTSSPTVNSCHRFYAGGDPIATNIVAVRVHVTQAENNGYSLYQAMFTGEPADADTVSWSVANVTAEDYSCPSDVILPSGDLIASTSGIDANETDGDITTSYTGGDYVTSGRRKDHEYEWNFAKAVNIREIQMYSNGTTANETAFCVSDVYVKYKGSDEYTRLAGSSFELLSGNPTNVRFASLTSRTGDKYAIRDVKALKVVLGKIANGDSGAHIAEVQLRGASAARPGFVIIVK